MSDVNADTLDGPARATFLREVPALFGLEEPALAALGAAMVVRHYPYKTVLSRLNQPVPGRALRIVLVGSVLVQTPGLDDARHVVGPGMLFGAEGVVAWAVARGLLAPLPEHPGDYHAYAAEDCWVLELPADRFARVFGTEALAPALAALHAAAWRAARATELVDALRKTSPLARAGVDDIHALIEGGRLRPFFGDEQTDPTTSVLVVLEGDLTLLVDGDTRVQRPGAVIGQDTFLRSQDPNHRFVSNPEDGAPVVLEIPVDHYERRLRACPELASAIDRAMNGALRRPNYRTEVALVLASEPLQRTLPLGPMTELLAHAIRTNLHDTTWVVELVWATPDPAANQSPQPPVVRLEVPRGTPAEVEAFVHASLLALLAEHGDHVHVLLVDPSALDPDVLLKRALAKAVADLPAPTTLSYMFSDPREWRRLLELLGLLVLRLYVLPTVVLDAPAPAPGLGAALDDIGEGALGRQPGALLRGLKALPAFALGQARRLAGLGADALQRAAAGEFPRRLDPSRQQWPKQAVRLRLSGPGRLALAERSARPQLADEDDRESFRRWARAITGRRVGIALGGAGALSYVCVPLIRALEAAGVPIDIVAGTSFGSIVGAYYTALGDAGLDLIVRHWYWAQITVAWGWITAGPLRQWINIDLGFVDISQVPVPFIPVATNAYNGREWDLRAGVVGYTCSASGALPPLAPTYDGDTRLLDGALSADVPDRVLVECGARLVIGANAIPPPRTEPPTPALPIPLLGDLLRELNPITRITDSIRGYEMLFRQAAQNQERYADVTYLADTKFGNGAAFFLRNALVYQGEHSETLREAVAKARECWLAMLGRPSRPSPGASPHDGGAGGTTTPSDPRPAGGTQTPRP